MTEPPPWNLSEFAQPWWNARCVAIWLMGKMPGARRHYADLRTAFKALQLALKQGRIEASGRNAVGDRLIIPHSEWADLVLAWRSDAPAILHASRDHVSEDDRIIWFDLRFEQARITKLWPADDVESARAQASTGGTSPEQKRNCYIARAELIESKPGETAVPSAKLTVSAPLASETPANDRRRTGLPGRPSSKDLVLTELKRRAGEGKVMESLAAEAQELSAWLKSIHPKEPQLTPKSTENAIRKEYRKLRNARPQRTKK